MLEFFRGLMLKEDSKILFILTLIVFAMIIDFFTGTVAAKINPNVDFISQKGINGILRKIVSVMILIFFIPLSVVLPTEGGTAFLYVFYLGYLFFELTSILENFEKLGVDVSLFKEFVKRVFKKGDVEIDDKL